MQLRNHKSLVFAGFILIALIASVIGYLPTTKPVLATTNPAVLGQSSTLKISAGADAHGSINWNELGWEGKKSSTVNYKVGIIDSGFYNYTTTANAGELPTLNSGRLFHQCYFKSGNVWYPSNSFHFCENAILNETHGTSVAEIILDIAPGVDLYVSNASTDLHKKAAAKWMADNGVIAINHSISSTILAPGDGTSAIADDVLSTALSVAKHYNNPIWVNSGGNESRVIWQGPYVDSDGDGYLNMATVGEVNSIDLTENKTVTFEARWKDQWYSKNRSGADCDLQVKVFLPSRLNLPSKASIQRQNNFSTDVPYDVLPHTTENIPGSRTKESYLVGLQVGKDGCSGTKPDWIQLRVKGDAVKDSALYWAKYKHRFSPTGTDYYQMTSVPEAKPATRDNGAVVAVAAASPHTKSIYPQSNRGPTLDNRQRPDITGSTCVVTRSDSNFCGTSAAAPHITGLAVLVKDRFPSKNGKNIVAYLHDNAVDLGNRGADSLYGNGFAALPGARLVDLTGQSAPDVINIDKDKWKSYRVSTPLAGNVIRVSVSSPALSLSSCTSTNKITSKFIRDRDVITVYGCSGAENATIKLYDTRTNLYRTYAVKVKDTTPVCQINEGRLSSSKTITGTLTSDCTAVNNPLGYAKYHTFTSTSSARLYDFTMTSNRQDFMHLLDGGRTDSRKIVGGFEAPGTPANIRRIIAPNTVFTLEAGVNEKRVTNYSVQINVSTPSTPPAPKGLSTSRCASSDCLDISWTGQKGVSNYRVYWQRTGDSSRYKNIAHNSTAGKTLSTRISTGVVCGQNYNVWVRGSGDGLLYLSGYGSSATDVQASRDCPQRPASPANLNSRGGDQTISISWSNPNDPSISGYQFRLRKTSNPTWSSWQNIPGSDANTTSYTIRNLDNDAEYRVRIRAKNDAGEGTESGDSTSTPRAPAVAPSAPTGLTATAGNQQISLIWINPLDNTITGYQYRLRTSSNWGSWQNMGNSDASTTTHVIAGLNNGTSYGIQIRARNSVGYSTSTSEVRKTPVEPTTAPNTPSGLSSTAGNQQITVTWANPSDGSITSYQYRLRTSNNANWLSWQNISNSDSTTIRHTITGLNNGTSYRVQIRARNSAGYSSASAEISQTPQAPATAPSAPTGLTATASNQQISLSWANPSDGTITGYQYRLRTQADSNWRSWQNIANSDSTTTSHTITGLINGTSYRVQIRARNSAGDSTASGETSATPQAQVVVPAAPTSLSGSSGTSVVLLQWSNPSDSSITGYEYRRRGSTSSSWGSWQAISDSNANTVSHPVYNLSSSTSYGFQVRAKNSAGNSPASSELRISTQRRSVSRPPSAPTGLTTAAGNQTLALVWNNPNNYSITSYEYRLRTPSDSDWQAWTTVPGSDKHTEQYTISNLTSGVVYRVQIRAKNRNGYSSPSNEATGTPLALPSAPTSFTATPGNKTITLAWANPNDATITEYEYRLKGETPSWGPWWSVVGSDASTTGYRVAGLLNGTRYYVQIRAISRLGNGSPSPEVRATPAPPAPPVPSAPTGLTATGGDQSLSLSWSNPNNQTITRYQYRIKSGSDWGDWKYIGDSGASTTSYTLTGLAHGTAYRVQIRALNAGGHSGASNEAQGTTNAAPPVAPTGLSVVKGKNQATISWADPNDARITGYQNRNRTGSGQQWGNWQDISGGGEVLSFTLDSLLVNTTYHVQVRGKYAGGYTAPGNIVTFKLAPPPNKPTDLVATGGNGTISLSWTGPAQSAVSDYQVRQRASWDSAWGEWEAIPNSGESTSSHTLSDLTNGTEYRVQIRARNTSGDGSRSATVKATPVGDAPAKPTGLTAEAGDASIVLSWDDPSNSSISEYQVRVRTGDDNWRKWKTIRRSTASTVSYTVLNLDNGTEYKVQVRAVNSVGNSKPSDVVTATPTAG